MIKVYLRSLNVFYYLLIYLNGLLIFISLYNGFIIFIKYLIKY